MPAHFARQADLQLGPVVLATRHGSWPARVLGGSQRWKLGRVPAAFLSQLQLVAGKAICVTVLCPGRLLITTEGEPQFSAALADAQQVLPPATVSELVPDVRRISVIKVCVAHCPY